jgi:hypothetical protein
MGFDRFAHSDDLGFFLETADTAKEKLKCIGSPLLGGRTFTVRQFLRSRTGESGLAPRLDAGLHRLRIDVVLREEAT